jgi:hypothetical protein
MEQRFALMLSICLFISACSTPGKKAGDKPNESPPPKMLAPSVRKVWVPPQLKDGGLDWEEGHYLYRIERGTSWSN